MSEHQEDQKSVNIDSGIREHIPSSVNFNNLFNGDGLKTIKSNIKSSNRNEPLDSKNNVVKKKIGNRISNQKATTTIEKPFNHNNESGKAPQLNTEKVYQNLTLKGSYYTCSNSLMQNKKEYTSNLDESESDFSKQFLLIQDKCYFAFGKSDEKSFYRKTKKKIRLMMKILFQNLNEKFLICMQNIKSFFLNLFSIPDKEKTEKYFHLTFFLIIIFFAIFLPYDFAFCQEECGKEIKVCGFVLNFLEMKFRSNRIYCKKRNSWKINFVFDFIKTISFLIYILKISRNFGILVFIFNLREFFYYENKLNHSRKRSLIDFFLIILKIFVGFGTFASIWFYVKEYGRVEGDMNHYSSLLQYINIVNNLMQISSSEVSNIKDYFEMIFHFSLRLFSLYAIGLLLFFFRMYSSERKIT